jgi:hypothetical protein
MIPAACPKCSKTMQQGALRVDLAIDSLDADCGAASSARVIVCASCATEAIHQWAAIVNAASNGQADK